MKKTLPQLLTQSFFTESFLPFVLQSLGFNKPFIFNDISIEIPVTIIRNIVNDNTILANDITIVNSIVNRNAVLDLIERLASLTTNVNVTNDIISFVNGTLFNIIPENSTFATDTLRSFINDTLTTPAVLTASSITLDSRNAEIRITGLIINVNQLSLTTGDSSIIITSASITEDEEIIINNIELELFGITFTIRSIKLSIVQLLSYIPDRSSSFEIFYPSEVTIMHNASSPHGIAAFRGEIINARMQECYNRAINLNTSNTAFKPATVNYLGKNHPLPLTAKQALEIRIVIALLACLFILVPLCYIPASFITFLVKERVSKAKHIQLVSSVSPYLYWFAVYLWDMFLYSILVLLIMAALFMYGQDAAQIFISVPEATFAIFLLFFLYGLSVLPLCYLYSMLFENHSTELISIMAINFATGFLAVLAYFVMSNIENTKVAAKRLVIFLRFFPTYNVGEGLINTSANYFRVSILNGNLSYFAFEVAGQNIVYMLIEAIGFFGIVLLTESSWLRNFIHKLAKIRAQRALMNMKGLNKSSTDVVVGNGDDVEVAEVGGMQGKDREERGVVSFGDNENEDEDVKQEELLVSKVEDKSMFALCIDGLVKLYPPTFFGGKGK